MEQRMETALVEALRARGQRVTPQRLMVAGIGGLIWMSLGAFIMAKMVSFEI